MIITTDDIDEFESAWMQVTRRTRAEENVFGAFYDGHEKEVELDGWLANSPHVLMAGANLQEFVFSHELPLYRQLVKKGIILGFHVPHFVTFTAHGY